MWEHAHLLLENTVTAVRSVFLMLTLSLSVLCHADKSLAEATPPAGEQTIDEKRIDLLIRQLGAEAYAERTDAEKELRAVGFAAFAKLRAAQNGEDPEIKSRAQRITGDFDAIQKLLDALEKDGHTSLYHGRSTKTPSALERLGEAVVPYLQHRLQAPAGHLYRFNCINLLDKIRCPASSALLRASVRDPHPWCRIEAVWALGNAKDSESLPLLLQAFEKDADETVRKEALLAIGKIWGMQFVGLAPQTFYGLSSDKYMTDEARAELLRLVCYFMQHDTLPDAEKLLGGERVLRYGLSENLEKMRMETWKVSTFQAPNGKGCWFVVRLSEDSVKKLGEAPFPGDAP